MIKLDSPSSERRLIPVWEITMPYAAAGLSAAITDTAAAAAAAALQSRGALMQQHSFHLASA